MQHFQVGMEASSNIPGTSRGVDRDGSVCERAMFPHPLVGEVLHQLVWVTLS